MRHHKVKRKFGRVRKVRRALLRSLIVSFIENGALTTTEAKAKELRPVIEKLITRSKSGTLAVKRLIIARTGSRPAAFKLTNDIAPRYKERHGGYTRVVKIGSRASDGSKIAKIELV